MCRVHPGIVGHVPSVERVTQALNHLRENLRLDVVMAHVVPPMTCLRPRGQTSKVVRRRSRRPSSSRPASFWNGRARCRVCLGSHPPWRHSGNAHLQHHRCAMEAAEDGYIPSFTPALPLRRSHRRKASRSARRSTGSRPSVLRFGARSSRPVVRRFRSVARGAKPA